MSGHRHRPAEELVTPEEAGWSYAGLRLVQVPPEQTRVIDSDDCELFVLPLAGALTVEVRNASCLDEVEARYELEGRASVFSRVTDFAYVGRDSRISLCSEQGVEVALPSARCKSRLPPRYGPAEAVPVEVRGAGPSTRQVTGFGVPGVWDHAERLVCCELITPGGNWSSYPPHKHDATEPCPVVNEEIYYYRIAGAGGVATGPAGYALHLTRTGAEHEELGLPPLDDRLVVRDGDVVLVPYGYHGPCAAAPGYDVYYLNVLAGPGSTRSMAFCDDPTHAWVRDAWQDMAPDPRVPLTSAQGRREA